MYKQRGLLPWILGGLTIAGVAAAIMVSSDRPVTPSLPQAGAPISAPVSLPLPAPATEAAPAPATQVASAVETADMPDASAPQPTAQAQTNTEPTVQSGQIWECTTNGQKTFSNNPCGDKPSLREVGPINTMDPTPLFAPSRSYEPQSSYQPEYSYPGTQESAGTSYPMVVAIPFYERRLPDHRHRPHDHDRGPPPRRN